MSAKRQREHRENGERRASDKAYNEIQIDTRTANTRGGTMHDWIEKGLLLGLGAIALTQEKSEVLVNELVERGEAHRDEASELVNRLTKRGEEERDALRKLVHEETERAVKRLDLATSKDIKALSRKIDALTKQLSEES